MSIDNELARGARFAFGENWAQFLLALSDERIRAAETSLQSMLGIENLGGKTFLDIGSGSGLFSLAARRLGATVHSFDYDPQSVACTAELKRRYFPDDTKWKIECGSALDNTYLEKLGQWDVVYSWGVLHHTGAMWRALENVAPLVGAGGHLFLAIYNDQGINSQIWLRVKRLYNQLPRHLRWMVLGPSLLWLWGPRTIYDLTRLRPFDRWRNYGQQAGRGMSPWRDVVDWVGGYPFEVAKPEEIFSFYKKRAFQLEQLKTCGGRLGCNQFVFSRR